MSSTMPVWSSTVIRSPSRIGCVNARRTPDPRLPSGVVSARPAMTASTALEREERTRDLLRRREHREDAPDADESRRARRSIRRRKLYVVRRRAATDGSVSARRRSYRSKPKLSSAPQDDHDESQIAPVTMARRRSSPRRRFRRWRRRACLELVAGEHASLGRRVLLVGQRAARMQVGERGEPGR